MTINKKLVCDDITIVLDELNLNRTYETAKTLAIKYGKTKMEYCGISGVLYLKKVTKMLQIADDFITGKYGTDIKKYLLLNKNEEFTGQINPVYSSGICKGEGDEGWYRKYELALCIISENELNPYSKWYPQMYCTIDDEIHTDKKLARLCLNWIDTTNKPRYLIDKSETLSSLKPKKAAIKGTDTIPGCVYQDAKDNKYLYLGDVFFLRASYCECCNYSRDELNDIKNQYYGRHTYLKLNKRNQKLYDESYSLIDFLKRIFNPDYNVAFTHSLSKKGFLLMIDDRFKNQNSFTINSLKDISEILGEEFGTKWTMAFEANADGDFKGTSATKIYAVCSYE